MNLTPDYQAIEEQIISAIKSLPVCLPSGTARNGDWTKQIKMQLRSIGEQHKFLVMPNDSEGQWLFDLIWFINDNSGHLRELTLALESEWGKDIWNIQEDFEKLLIAKAHIKVMLFQDNGNNLSEIWQYLATAIKVFEMCSPGEIYILAAFKEEQHEYEIKVVRT